LTYTEGKISVMRTLGVPYAEGYEDRALNDLNIQAERIAKSIAKDLDPEASDERIAALGRKEVVALIGYLQRLGSDIHQLDDPDVELISGTIDEKQ
jgi:cytochrome c oxidase cbb3-type subunit I/II